MKHKKSIWILVAVIALGLIVANGVALWRTQHASSIDTTASTTPDTAFIPLTIASSTKTVQTKLYAVQFDFPVTNNEGINQTIKSFVDETVDAFIKEVEQFEPFPTMEGRQYTMRGWFEPHLDTPFNTIMFSVAVDTGGAHPNQFIYTKTFDQSGKEVGINDVITVLYGVDTTLATIAEQARTILYQELGDAAEAGWVDDGTQPSEEHFADFYTDQGTLVVLFEPYAIGPYVWGARYVRIPQAEPITATESASTTATTTPIVQ